MDVEFYFDPSCPFCWITSRWLITVQNNKPDINITWQPFSLAIKNNELDSESGHHLPAHRVLRVILAANKTGADMGELYTDFGTRSHVGGDSFSDEMITKVLQQQKLSPNLAESADDSSLDSELETSINSALEVVGNDVGVPIIIFNKDGNRYGYFGPVLNSMPSVSDSLKLWDGLVTMATTQEFYELKRSRDSGGPNAASTAVCVP